MKQWYFHVIYLSIIAFLGYNYWRDPSVKKAILTEKTSKTMNYCKYMIVGLSIFFYSIVQGQTPLLKNYDFNNGGYYLIGITSEGGKNSIVDSLGDFYTNDIAVLNAIKKEWIFKKPSPMYSCGYNYTVYIYQYGLELESFNINLNCNIITTNRSYFYFDTQKISKFMPSFKQPYWVDYRKQWYHRFIKSKKNTQPNNVSYWYDKFKF
jgi:hypothetical protein